MNKIQYGLLLLSLDAVTYFNIRAILWSIIWLERRGKYNKLREFKRSLSWNERIPMKSLIRYIEKNRKQYEDWMRIKNVYIVLQLIFLAIFTAFLFVDSSCYDFLMIILIAQSGIWFLIIRLQFDSGWNTKYDLRRHRFNR